MKASDIPHGFNGSKRNMANKFSSDERVFSRSSITSPNQNLDAKLSQMSMTDAEYSKYQFQAPPIKFDTESKSGSKVGSRRGNKKTGKRI